MMSTPFGRESANGILDLVSEPGSTHRGGRRSDVDQAIRRAVYLSAADRTIVVGMLAKGMSTEEIANLTRMSQSTIRRRIRKLTFHLISDLFSFVLAHRGAWNADKRRIAELRFLQRQTLRETARKSGVSMHHVRLIEREIRHTFDLLHHELI